MKKFIFIFYGGSDYENASEEVRAGIMEQWTKWFASFGEKIVDGGGPFAQDAHAVTKMDTHMIGADMWPAKGYTIISVASMDEAVEIAKGCPSIRADEKDATVRVYEITPM